MDKSHPIFLTYLEKMNKLDLRFLAISKKIAEWSKDPSKKIGCVIVNDKKTIISQGYNGFPRGVEDLKERLTDRTTKYKFVVHAEMNAIFNATYNGVSLDGTTAYIWGLPVCNECAKGLIQCGVKRIVSVDAYDDKKWSSVSEISKIMFDETDVEYTEYTKSNYDYWEIVFDERTDDF